MDVDGSYLYKKSKQLENTGVMVAPLDLTSAPAAGWELLTEVNASDFAKKLPCW